MKRLILILAVIGLSIPAWAGMTGQELYSYFIPPYSYQSWGRGYAEGYISGVINAALGCPSGKYITEGEAWQLVQNYLQAHPEEWNKAATLLIGKALDPVCHY